ncbi:DUF4179 domain-containing protein [Fictibacillus nanhaiensis]|uniref:DUF4179 domain-containing protein n=1 Tax=Fictibacillus nanhaiensis TaxID=742169 RepID=A0ABS2ZNI0_9BACL|nr:DUF4179 domain-containing protein [Fictibacillus nanhaiensis]
MLNEDNNLQKNLNDNLQNLHPPSSLHTEIKQRIISEKSTTKSWQKLKINIVRVSTVCIILILLFGSGFVSPRLGNVLQKIPVVGYIYKDYQSDIGLQKAEEVGLTEDFQKTVTSEGVEVTFTKIYYDGVNLSIGYKIKNNTSQEWPDPPEMGVGASHFLILKGQHEFKINGSEMMGGMNDTFEEVGSNEYEGVLQFHPNKFPKEDNFTLDCFFTEIQGVKGEWKFKVPVTKEKVKETVHSFEPNYKVDGLDGEIIVSKVDFTPTAIGLETKMIREITEENKNDYFLFSIVEVGADNGVIADAEKLKNGKIQITTKSSFPPIKEVPEFITIKAYNPSDSSESVQFKVPLKE